MGGRSGVPAGGARRISRKARPSAFAARGPVGRFCVRVEHTQVGGIAAQSGAESLCVSKQAIRLWISRYNRQGPEGLDRQGRGGRRWPYLSLAEEQALLQDWQEQAVGGEALTAKPLQSRPQKAAGRKISLGYVYRRLHRHGWRKPGLRPGHSKAQPAAQGRVRGNFPKSSTPYGGACRQEHG